FSACLFPNSCLLYASLRDKQPDAASHNEESARVRLVDAESAEVAWWTNGQNGGKTRPRALRRRVGPELLEQRCGPPTFTQTTLPDSYDASLGDRLARDLYNLTSLRAAIEEANALPGPDIINFDPSSTSGGTITLDAIYGQLEIGSDVTINGSTSGGNITVTR